MITLRSYLAKFPQLTIVFSILLLYVPFYFEPILRPTGDEKVYIAQALEMQEKGTWFLQWLAGQQNYHKGPAFYLLLRLGFLIFGTSSMWSVLYMNLIGLTFSSLILYTVFSNHLKKKSAMGLFVCLSYCYSVGIYFHMFASQMEALQVSFYTIILCLLYLSESKESRPFHQLGLWLSIGFIGLLKSPIYSVLPGISVLLVWLAKGNFFARMTNHKVLARIGAGVALVILGLAPAFVFDQKNFVDTYLIRETLNKGSNSVPWYATALPPFTLYLFPWIFPAIVCFGLGTWQITQRKLKFSLEESLFLKCCILLTLPTLIFFTIHPYRSEVYTLPLVPCSLGLFAVLMEKYLHKTNSLLKLAFLSTAAFFAFLIFAITYLHFTLDPFPTEWWPNWLTIACVSLTSISAAMLIIAIKGPQKINLSRLALAPIPFYIALALFLGALGKRDLFDFSANISKLRSSHSEYLSYWNIPRHTWSEWGALNMWLHHPVKGVHELNDLDELVQKGGILIVPERNFNDFSETLTQKFDSIEFQISKIRRWMVHGKTPKGDKHTLKQFLESGDIKDIERYDYWIRFAP